MRRGVLTAVGTRRNALLYAIGPVQLLLLIRQLHRDHLPTLLPFLAN